MPQDELAALIAERFGRLPGNRYGLVGSLILAILDAEAEYQARMEALMRECFPSEFNGAEAT